MDLPWFAGWVAPLLMLAVASFASARRHRWRCALWAGSVAGGGFCLLAWFTLRAALAGSAQTLEIVFLQVALSSAGLFIFGVTSMLAWKWQTR